MGNPYGLLVKLVVLDFSILISCRSKAVDKYNIMDMQVFTYVAAMITRKCIDIQQYTYTVLVFSSAMANVLSKWPLPDVCPVPR